MKCFRSVNGLYCKNPEYARLLPPPKKKFSLTREKSRPRLDFAILQARSMKEPPPNFAFLQHRSMSEKPAPRIRVLQARSITLGVLAQKPAC